MTLRSLLLAGATAFALSLPGSAAAEMAAATTTDLNLRTGPGTGHGIIMAMPAGAYVTIHQCGAGWCEVSYGNRTGWASQRYLDTQVAQAPRRGWAQEPEPVWRGGPRVEFHVGPRRHWRDWRGPERYVGWHHPRWWHGRPAGWYGPIYWDRDRWWYEDRWHRSPGFAIHLDLN